MIKNYCFEAVLLLLSISNLSNIFFSSDDELHSIKITKICLKSILKTILLNLGMLSSVDQACVEFYHGSG